jgi:hypothetical protein
MNTTTTTRFAKYAGAGLAGIATSCALAAPALAMRPDPIPSGGQNHGTTNSREQSVQNPSVKPAPPSTNSGVGTYGGSVPLDGQPVESRQGPTTTPASTVAGSTSGGIDWSTLATGLSGGVLLSGAVVGAAQLRRRQARPA